MFLIRSLFVWGLCYLAAVPTAFAQDFKTTTLFEGGIDFWSINPQADPNDDASISNHRYLSLPDDTKWPFRSASPWFRFTGNAVLTPHLEANIKVRADQSTGGHIDVANLAWAPSPFIGVRAGVLNYQANWCRTYDVDSPWAAEPDIFCRNSYYMAFNNAAPGVQAYINTDIGDYRLQSVLGVYRPLLGDYDTKEFGVANPPAGPFTVNFNRKIGAAVNVLNTLTATQLRIGVVYADVGGSYNPKTSRDRHSLIDNYYLGLDTYLHPAMRLRYSWSIFYSTIFLDDYALAATTDTEKSETLELIYERSDEDQFVLGFSNQSITAAVDDRARNVKIADYFYLHNPTQSVAWRHQWGKGIFSTVQWTGATQTNGYQGDRTTTRGEALGMRLGFQY